jgi:hypothetical protein
MKLYLAIVLVFTSHTLLANVIRVEVSTNTSGLVPDWIVGCLHAATEQVDQQAKAWELELVPDSLRAVEYNANLLAKYIWWQADTTTPSPKGHSHILVMTQKTLGGECF